MGFKLAGCRGMLYKFVCSCAETSKILKKTESKPEQIGIITQVLANRIAFQRGALSNLLQALNQLDTTKPATLTPNHDKHNYSRSMPPAPATPSGHLTLMRDY